MSSSGQSIRAPVSTRRFNGRIVLKATIPPEDVNDFANYSGQLALENFTIGSRRGHGNCFGGTGRARLFRDCGATGGETASAAAFDLAPVEPAADRFYELTSSHARSSRREVGVWSISPTIGW